MNNFTSTFHKQLWYRVTYCLHYFCKCLAYSVSCIMLCSVLIVIYLGRTSWMWVRLCECVCACEHVHMHLHACVLMNGRVRRCIDECIVGWMDGCMGAAWMDGWTDGLVNVMHVLVCVYTHFSLIFGFRIATCLPVLCRAVWCHSSIPVPGMDILCVYS
jgi:hypothetical protein